MTVELITGQGGTSHIGSEDDGAYHAATYGSGIYVLSGCTAEIVDSNTIRISEGEVLIEGRHVRVKGSEDIAIQSGSIGYYRSDLIVFRYTKDIQSIEEMPLVVIPGTKSESTPSDPSYVNGSILAGDAEADFPLYRVKVEGLTVCEPELLQATSKSMMDYFESGLPTEFGGTGNTNGTIAKLTTARTIQTNLASTSSVSFDGSENITPGVTGTLPIARGGTGVTSEASLGLKAYPVGAVYISYASTSPASLFGGTWTQITGKFLRMANDTNTGGSDTHTHTLTSGYAYVRCASAGTAFKAATSVSEYTIAYEISGTKASKSYTTTEATPLGGSSGSASTMPAYQDLYAWRRTA